MKSAIILRVSFLAFCFLVATPVFLHFTPGALSPDSISILSQARSGIFEDGHPPLMAAIWRLIDYCMAGSIGMLLLNLSLFYGGIYLIFIWAVPRYKGWVFPAALVVGLSPPIIGILGAIWIDITMAAFFLVAVGVSLTGYNQPLKKSRICIFLLALFIVSLGMAIRHNAVAAALPLITLFLLQYIYTQGRSLRRFTVALISGLIITLLFFVIVKQVSALSVDKQRHLWRVAALYDISGVSCRENSSLFYADVIRENSLENICKLYSPRSLTPLLLGQQVHALAGEFKYEGKPVELNLSNIDLNHRLFSNWVSVITNNPFAYLMHRYDVFQSLVTRSPWGLWAPVFEAVYANELNILERTTGNLSSFSIVRVLALKSIVFVPLLYLVLSAIFVIPILVIGLYFKNNVMLLASALYGSGLTHMTGLFFMAASADFRYSHWMIITTTIATCLVTLELIRTTSDYVRIWLNKA